MKRLQGGGPRRATNDHSTARPMKRTIQSSAESRESEQALARWLDDRSLETANGRLMSRNKTRILDTSVGGRQTRRVQWGDTVCIDFMVWLEDGSLIDSSIYSEPPTFTAGMHSVMQGIEQLVIGMRVGESKTEKIPPDLAFGLYRLELSCQIDRNWLETQMIEPQVCLCLDVRKTDGTLVLMIITGMDGDHVTLDANHRLAGKDLLVQLDLLEIVDRAGSRVHAVPAMDPWWKRQSR